jgi:hypothetical protein
MGYGTSNKKRNGGGGGGGKKPKTSYESWAAGTLFYKELCNKLEDGTVDGLMATGRSLPEISKQLFPNHNPTAFNTTVKKARAAIGLIVGKKENTFVIIVFLFRFFSHLLN